MVKKGMELPLLLAGFLLAAALAGCGLSKHVDDRANPNSALVFGFIDADRAPSNITWAEARQLKPDILEPYRKFRSDGDGMFYLENLPLGSFRMADFGGSGWGCLKNRQCIARTNYSYQFPSDNPGFEKLAFRLKKPGLYYAGSYKIEKVKTGMFSKEYEFVKIGTPDEKDLLKQLLVYTSGTKWHELILKRLETMK